MTRRYRARHVVPRRRAAVRRRFLATLAVAAALLLAVGGLAGSPAGAAPAPEPVPTVAPAAGAYYPVPVHRLLGGGDAGTLPTAGRSLAGGQALHVPVLGLDGLPASGVSAVVLNLTATAGSTAVSLRAQPATGPLSAGFPEAMSAGTPRGTTALTVPAGRTRTALATVPLDPDGAFDLTALGGPATVTVDLVGLYAADDTVVAMLGTSGGYQPIDPVRLLGSAAVAAATPSVAATGSSTSSSTPSGPPGPGLPAAGQTVPQASATVDASLAGAVAARSTRRLAVDLGGDISPHVTALVLRVSAVGASAVGTVSVTGPAATGDAAASTPGGAAAVGTDDTGDADDTPATTDDAGATRARPTAYAVPTLALDPGATASNLAIVPAVLEDDGTLALEVANSSTAATDVRVDLVGFFDDGGLGPDLRFRSLPPSRLVDTRSRLGLTALAAGGRSQLHPAPEVLGDNTFGLVGTLGVTSASPGTDLELGGDELSSSAASTSASASGSEGSVPLAVDEQLTTPVMPEVTASGALVVTSSTGPAELVLDVVGSLEAYPAVSDPSTRGWVPVVAPWQVTASAR